MKNRKKRRGSRDINRGGGGDMGPEWEGEEVTMPYYDRIHRDFAMQNVNTAQFMHISMQETSYFDV